MSELKRVYWDAGHGGDQPGAVKYVVEKDVNIKVVNYGCAYMEENYLCEVYKDISADSISTICARANKWRADLFLSVHFNAGGGNGFEALIYDILNKDLGLIFAKHAAAVGQNLRSSSVASGVKYRPDLGVLRLTTMPAVLNEVAFVDNWDDIKDWNDDAELRVMGIALAKAAAEYLSLPKKATGSGTSKASDGSFLVQVKIKDLYIRTGAGTKYKHKGFIKPGVYTIVETDGNWGKLKSGAGWIHLGYTKKL